MGSIPFFSTNRHQSLSGDGDWWRFFILGGWSMAESRLNLARARCPSCGSMGLVAEEWPLTAGEISETGRKKLPVLICEARCGWHVWGWYQGRRMVFGNFWTMTPEAGA